MNNKEKAAVISIILLLSIITVDGSNISANVTILPYPPSLPYTYPSSTTSGSGGYGVITDEPFTNIECSNRLEHDWRVNSTISYLFRNCDEYDAVINTKENEDSVMVKLEILKDKSNNTPADPSGSIYKYFNLYSGSKRFDRSTIKFRVDSAWASNMEVVTLMKWNNNTWTALETRQISLNDTCVYYESDTGAFSNFVIIGIPKTIEPLPSTSPDLVPSPTITKQSIYQEPVTIKTPGFEILTSLISLILISLRRRP